MTWRNVRFRHRVYTSARCSLGPWSKLPARPHRTHICGGTQGITRPGAGTPSGSCRYPCRRLCRGAIGELTAFVPSCVLREAGCIVQFSRNAIVGEWVLVGPHCDKQVTGLRPARDRTEWLSASLNNERLSCHFHRRELIRMWVHSRPFSIGTKFRG
jgi:hypothetical protein